MAGRKKTSPISDYVKRSTPDSFSYPRKVSEETKQESKDKYKRDLDYDPYYTVRTDSRYRNRRPQRRSSR